MDAEYAPSKSNGRTAVVIGAGMGGLMAAAALSGFFTNVVIVERDELPRQPALRKGVPQFARGRGQCAHARLASDAS